MTKICINSAKVGVIGFGDDDNEGIIYRRFRGRLLRWMRVVIVSKGYDFLEENIGIAIIDMSR